MKINLKDLPYTEMLLELMVVASKHKRGLTISNMLIRDVLEELNIE